jgi:hypothetical protein
VILNLRAETRPDRIGSDWRHQARDPIKGSGARNDGDNTLAPALDQWRDRPPRFGPLYVCSGSIWVAIVHAVERPFTALLSHSAFAVGTALPAPRCDIQDHALGPPCRVVAICGSFAARRMTVAGPLRSRARVERESPVGRWRSPRRSVPVLVLPYFAAQNAVQDVSHVQSLSRRRAFPFSSFSVSSGPSGSVFSHSVPGGFSANG